MRKFSKLILSSFILFMLLWGTSEWAVKKVGTDYTRKYNHVKDNPAITTLLMGASFFENGINPHLLQDNDSIYDFAISAREIYWDVRLAEKLFPTMPNLRTVLFPIGYDVMYRSLHYYPCRPQDEVIIYQYQKYMEVYYDRAPQKYTCRSGLYMNQMGFKLWRKLAFDSLGQYALIGQHPHWEDNADHNIMGNEVSRKSYVEYTQYLKQLAAICYEHDIRFITVTTPCADFYVNQVTEDGLEYMYAMIDTVRSYYPIEYKNYLDDAEFRADSIYYNAKHLNNIGADMFAKRVRADFNL